jgi:hypothetical protein
MLEFRLMKLRHRITQKLFGQTELPIDKSIVLVCSPLFF